MPNLGDPPRLPRLTYLAPAAHAVPSKVDHGGAIVEDEPLEARQMVRAAIADEVGDVHGAIVVYVDLIGCESGRL